MLEQYNERVMAVVCPTCGAGPRQRCKATRNGQSTVMRPIKPHKARLREAEKDGH